MLCAMSSLSSNLTVEAKVSISTIPRKGCVDLVEMETAVILCTSVIDTSPLKSLATLFLNRECGSTASPPCTIDPHEVDRVLVLQAHAIGLSISPRHQLAPAVAETLKVLLADVASGCCGLSSPSIATGSLSARESDLSNVAWRPAEPVALSNSEINSVQAISVIGGPNSAAGTHSFPTRIAHRKS
jgi:hypothetical protein